MNRADARQVAELELSRLNDLHVRGGFIPAAAIEAAASRLARSPRTIHRWLARGEVPGGESRAYKSTKPDIEAFFECNGSYRRAYDKLIAHGAAVPLRRTWERAINRRLRPDERAFARYGEDGRRRHQLYLDATAEHRNEMWEVDQTPLDVWVLPNRGLKLERPSLIVYVDSATRAIMGYTLSFTHTAEDALAGLRHAIFPDNELGPFHGAPTALRFDNAREFLSDAFSDALGTLGVQPLPADPYTPYQKGKVERLLGTVNQEFCATLPAATAAPRTANPKRSYGAHEPLTMAELARALRDYVRRYNLERAHRSLGGDTPRDRWQADQAPIRVPPGNLGWLLRGRATRKIGKDGIHFEGVVYLAPELNGLAREEVEVAYLPNDPRWIDVYRDGEYLATAWPRDSLNADERLEFLRKRRADRKAASTERAKASKAQRREFEGLRNDTGTGKGRRDRRGKRSARGLGGLLGLDKYRPRDEDDG